MFVSVQHCLEVIDYNKINKKCSSDLETLIYTVLLFDLLHVCVFVIYIVFSVVYFKRSCLSVRSFFVPPQLFWYLDFFVWPFFLILKGQIHNLIEKKTAAQIEYLFIQF